MSLGFKRLNPKFSLLSLALTNKGTLKNMLRKERRVNMLLSSQKASDSEIFSIDAKVIRQRKLVSNLVQEEHGDIVTS